MSTLAVGLRPLAFDRAQAGWKHQPMSKLKRDTAYSIAKEDGRAVLRASADRSASFYAAYFQPPAGAPASLSWRWKTDALVPGADNREKDKEDAPLRVIDAFDGDKSRLPAEEKRRFDAALEDLPLGDEVYVGVFLCSHNPAVLEQAVFRDVRIIRTAKPDFTPYRDYIGSLLEVLDVATGRRQVVRRSAEPFEAPNWSTDGASLIYNTSGRSEGRGRLHRFELSTRQSMLIDSGFAIRNNNDHVLSFDARMLAISDLSQDEGRSTVYTLPTTGGTPRRITPKTPSYLHGWSPDGKWLVYTGGRNGEFDIYKIASDGSGEEVRLTDFRGLDDGPEYRPDGKYIYSDREENRELFNAGVARANGIE